MEFKDYCATLGVERSATQNEIKRAYRKLARKFHPDVSKEADAESHFKEVAEAHEALIDPERRAAYDEISQRHSRGEAFEPPPGWGSGFEFSGRGGAEPGTQGRTKDAAFSAFFESIFGRGGQDSRPGAGGYRQTPGRDHHARVTIDLESSYRGARRTISLRMPAQGAQGAADRHLRRRRGHRHPDRGLRVQCRALAKAISAPTLELELGSLAPPAHKENTTDIKVLGPGCANCKATIALIEQVAQAKGVPVTLGKVEEEHPWRRHRRQGGAHRRYTQPRQDREVADRLNLVLPTHLSRNDTP